jgi:hypothetical protein
MPKQAAGTLEIGTHNYHIVAGVKSLLKARIRAEILGGDYRDPAGGLTRKRAYGKLRFRLNNPKLTHHRDLGRLMSGETFHRRRSAGSAQ